MDKEKLKSILKESLSEKFENIEFFETVYSIEVRATVKGENLRLSYAFPISSVELFLNQPEMFDAFIEELNEELREKKSELA